MRLRTALVAAVAAAPLLIGAPNLASANAASRVRTITGIYLRDGFGSGSAASANPGGNPGNGTKVHMESAGAWRVDFEAPEGAIYLYSRTNLCFTNVGGIVEFKTCDGDNYQIWESVGNNGRIKNPITGEDLCAEDGVGSDVLAELESFCSTYHDEWAFCNEPQGSCIVPKRHPARKE
jgi:hypothetical protein